MIQNAAHQKICKAMIRKSDVDRTVVETLCQSNPVLIIEGAAQIVKKEIAVVCKRGSGCPLQKKGYEDVFNFSWTKLHDYLQENCPAFLSVITATVCDVSSPVLSKSYQHILLTAAVGLHGRSQEMSLVQYLVGFMLKHGGCTERVTIIF